MTGFGSTTPMIESGFVMIPAGNDNQAILIPQTNLVADPLMKPIVTVAPYDSTTHETGEMDLNPHLGTTIQYRSDLKKWEVRIWRGANLSHEGTKVYWKAVFLKHIREVGPSPTIANES